VAGGLQVSQADATTLSESTVMFEIYANDTLVGRSALELGDPPMGVAFGQFIAAPGYRKIQQECRASLGDQTSLALSVKTPTGDLVPCAGVGIQDVSPDGEEVDPTWVEVSVLGIPYPLYSELFPEHVTGYEKQFGGG
jgi:hypothetical protein